jgi:hypothetical protein
MNGPELYLGKKRLFVLLYIFIFKGASMWLSTNYLLNLLDPFIPAYKTSITVDLGGAST